MTELEIASYLDKGMSKAERARLESHFANCVECRTSLSETQRVIASIERPHRLVTLAVMGALAAGLAIIVAPQLSNRISGVRPTRDSNTSAAIAVYSPRDKVGDGMLRFTWGRVPNATSYRVTLSTTDGTTLWSRSSTDTIAILPDSVKLTPMTSYVWFADALMSDGTSRSTGLQGFQATRAEH